MLKTEQKYRSPFAAWDEKSWIRSKPLRKGEITKLPFAPDLMPLTSHSAIALMSE